ncbi:MAG: sodium-dependent transporter [Acidobacteria bacterium]|nr:sodium-dependent transporter [Acidobacteriota bacterium]
MKGQETFSSRWGLIAAGLGMAVGTGNLWRFPRIAAQNGGAAFLIPWMVFLFTWSLPLLIAEFAIGRGMRRGVVGSFTRLVGPRYAWMGGWVAVVTVMILFYYSVVTGWTLKYLVASLTGELRGVEPGQYWSAYVESGWGPVLFHVIAALLGGFVILQGVVKGIERANKILIPSLFVLLIVAAVRSVSLPGAERGLEFLFNPDLSSLAHYRTWLEALSQSAWSTGAGWGLILTYGMYLRRTDDVVLNSATIGFGDHSASLLAGMAVLPAAFAILAPAEAMDAMRAGNVGLMFIWIPQLFARMPGGDVFQAIFFLALFCAALSSLIALIELATRVLMDAAVPRRPAVALVTGAVIVFGLPSALSQSFFANQDWVWGVGLMISGLFIALAATMYGQARFRTELVEGDADDLRVGRYYEWALKYLVPVQFAMMFSWWMYQAASWDPEGWWNPFHVENVGTCLLQWGVAMALLLLFNRRMAAASIREEPETQA